MWTMHVGCMLEEVQHMSKACSIINERRDECETKENTCKTHVREDDEIHHGCHMMKSHVQSWDQSHDVIR